MGTIEYLRAMNEFTHLDSNGQVHMVDVGGKSVSHRTAKAMGRVQLPMHVMRELSNAQFQSRKGSVLQTAILAGIMGAKKTSDLIPLCHPLLLSKVDVKIEREQDLELELDLEQELEQEQEREALVIYAEVRLDGKTGVEMEALTAVSIAALTIYDMCKALSHDIRITDIQLMEKTGGKNDFVRA